MEIGAILLILALTALFGLFIAQPFYNRPKHGVVSAEENELSHLMAERDRILSTLQELDFDFMLEKIPAEDYPAMRASLLHAGAETLRQLDGFVPSSGSSADAESRIEAVVASRLEDAVGKREISGAALADDDIEALISARRSQRKERTAGFCPKCGKPVTRSDKFCPSCGKSM